VNSPIYRESPLASSSTTSPPSAQRSYLQLMARYDRSLAPAMAHVASVGAITADADADALDEDLAAVGTGVLPSWTGPIYLLSALVLFAGLETLLMASGALQPIPATAVSLAISAVLLLWPAIRSRWQARAPREEAAVVEQAKQSEHHDTEEMPFPPGAFDPDLDLDDLDEVADSDSDSDSGSDLEAESDLATETTVLASGNAEAADAASDQLEADDDADDDATALDAATTSDVDARPKTKLKIGSKILDDIDAYADTGLNTDVRADDAVLDVKAGPNASATSGTHLDAEADMNASTGADPEARDHAPASAVTDSRG
jgi:hypothetical protein